MLSKALLQYVPKVFVVSGVSMEPHLGEGDVVFARRAESAREVGTMVVYGKPHEGVTLFLIKFVSSNLVVQGREMCKLVGTSSLSMSEEQIGLVPSNALFKVFMILRLSRPGKLRKLFSFNVPMWRSNC